MPGILEQEMPPQQNPLARQNIRQEGAELAQGQPQPGGQGQQVSGEQQKQYDVYVGNGMKIIHGEKNRDTIIDILKNGKPVDATADATLMVMAKLDTDSASEAVQIPKEVKLHAGNALMGEVIDVGEASGIFPQPLNEVEREAAMRIAVGKYSQAGVENGTITRQELKEGAAAAEQVYPNFEQEVQQFAQMTQPKTGPGV